MISKHFKIEEFVPKIIFTEFGVNAKWFIRPELITTAEFIREWFDAPMIINNWKTGGDFQFRGFRPCSYSGGGALSQHRLGCAIDYNIKGLTPQRVFKEIMDHQNQFRIGGVTTMEDVIYTKTWTHNDIRNTGLTKLLIVKP